MESEVSALVIRSRLLGTLSPWDFGEARRAPPFISIAIWAEKRARFWEIVVSCCG